MPMNFRSIMILPAAVVVIWGSFILAAAPDPEEKRVEAGGTGVEFFEKKIRPVLVENCYKCHSEQASKAGKLKAGLHLDSRAGMLQGGDSGPVVVAGKPGDSLVIKALKHETVKMPPKGKMPRAVVEDFEAWIAAGAADPRQGAAPRAKAKIDIQAGRSHWAYQPVRRVAAPPVKDQTWAVNEVDQFILAELEARNLRPAPQADLARLVRRLYFDLTGLPPTPEQIDAHLRDESPDAWERLVDRLLASPAFGERFGRHWLDVARYAESLTLRGFILHSAWRYRDFVIEAMNEDAPYDQFIRMQIAGDLLPAADLRTRRRNLVATSFLALGNTNLEEQDKAMLRMDVVDEQLDTIGKAILGQTIGCARCHDHKFDPIPTRDYYAMAGILRNTRMMEHANVSKWMEIPLPLSPEEEAELQRHESTIAALKEKIKTAKGKPAAILAVADLPGVVVDESKAQKVGDWKASQFSGRFIGDGYLHDQNSGKGERTLTFQPELPRAGRYEIRLAYSHGDSRSTAVPITIFSAEGEKLVEVDQKKQPPIDGRFVSLGVYRFELNGQGYVIISNKGTKGHVTADAVQFLPVDEAAPGAPAVAPGQRKPAAPSKAAAELDQMEKQLKKLIDSGPHRPMIISVKEEPQIADAPIHIRGSASNLGSVAPRGFMSVAMTDPAPSMPADQSGRRELADWLASSRNPLTARVMANRLWHWLMGAGLVRTTDQFGSTGEQPSHPMLLDALAARFIEEGWSIKRMVRLIALSRTYRQSSADDERGHALDPENRLFWRAHRRRLEAECIWDAMRMVSGELKQELGGRTIRNGVDSDFGYKHGSSRRAVYWPVFRNSMPEVLDLFDAADPSMTTGRRNVSTVAPQALFMMNHPQAIEQAKLAAARLLAEPHLDDPARLDRLYRLALGRFPTPAEQRLALRYLEQTAGDAEVQGVKQDPIQAWTGLIQAIFATIDFRFSF